jgi:hypothetical protein
MVADGVDLLRQLLGVGAGRVKFASDKEPSEQEHVIDRVAIAAV